MISEEWRVFDYVVGVKVKVLFAATRRGKVIFSLRRIYAAAVAHRGRGNCNAREIALEGSPVLVDYERPFCRVVSRYPTQLRGKRR